jgi:hypothetical protein
MASIAASTTSDLFWKHADMHAACAYVGLEEGDGGVYAVALWHCRTVVVLVEDRERQGSWGL